MEAQIKKRLRHPNRVTLSAETLDILDKSINETVESKMGVMLSRNDMVEWLVKSFAPGLRAEQRQALAEAHYDELRFMRQALKALQKAKRCGETLSINGLLHERTTPKVAKPKSIPKKGGKDLTQGAASDASALTDKTNENLNDL